MASIAGTCFGDDSGVFADASIIAHATDVLTEHTEGVFIPHHQIRHGATRSAIVFKNSEPLLKQVRDRFVKGLIHP